MPDKADIAVYGVGLLVLLNGWCQAPPIAEYAQGGQGENGASAAAFASVVNAAARSVKWNKLLWASLGSRISFRLASPNLFGQNVMFYATSTPA